MCDGAIVAGGCEARRVGTSSAAAEWCPEEEGGGTEVGLGAAMEGEFTGPGSEFTEVGVVLKELVEEGGAADGRGDVVAVVAGAEPPVPPPPLLDPGVCPLNEFVVVEAAGVGVAAVGVVAVVGVADALTILWRLPMSLASSSKEGRL